MARDELVAKVQNRFQTAREYQRDKFDKFNDFDFIFNSKLKKYDPNIPSKVFNPILWSFIETVITRMLAKSPVVAYKPRNPDDQAQAETFTELFSYWFDKCNIYPEVVAWVKNALIYGTGIIKVDWYTSRPRMVKSYMTDEMGETLLDENGKLALNETPVIDYDDPRLKLVNVYDFFIDPSATSIHNAKWLIHQYWADIKDLEYENEAAIEKGLEPIYNKSAFKRIRTDKQSDINEYESRRKEATGLTTGEVKDRTIDRILIWEMWEDDRLVIVADGMEVIRDSKNPYWHGQKPFVGIVDSIVPHEFWGKGEIEPVEKMLHALNTTQNQRITNVNRILSPMWKATNTIDDDELNFTDNGIIHVSQMTDVDMMLSPNVTGTAFQEAQAIKEDIQRALGVTDYTQGLDTPNQTAKEVEIKTSQSNARFAHKVKIFEEMGLKVLGELVYKLYQQYVTKEKVIKVTGQTGDEFIRLTPADLVGEFDVIPESDSTLAVDSEAEFAKFFNLYNVLRPNPMMNGLELDKELLNRSGEKEPDRFFMQQGGMDNGQADQQLALPSELQQGTLPVDQFGGMESMVGQDQGVL